MYRVRIVFCFLLKSARRPAQKNGEFSVFSIINGKISVFFSKKRNVFKRLVQISEEINTENFAAVSHALLYKKTENGTLFTAEKNFFKR